MDPIVALSFTLVALFVLILLRVPIAFALLGAGAVGLLMQEGPQVAMSVISNQPYGSVASFTLIVVPLFIAVGVFAKQAGVAQATYGYLSKTLRRFPGGLGVATIAACAAFGAVSGSSTATAATIGKISIDEMIRDGYPPKFAGAIVASGGTLGILIPPSIALVLYGIITGESISELLLAGIIPGILSAVALAVAVVIRMLWVKKFSKKEKERVLATAAVRVATAEAERDSTVFAAQAAEITETSPEISSALPDMKVSNWGAVGIVVVLFAVIMGGMYSGVFTATEAAGVGAAIAFAFMLIISLTKDRANTGKRVLSTLKETVSISGMIFAIFIGAGMFNYLLVSGRIPHDMAREITSWDVAPEVVVLLFLLILLPLGMLLDGNAMLLIIAPIAYPIVTGLGFDGVWFAILFVKMIEIGLLTPPVGLNAFVVAGVTKKVSAGQVFKGVWPFLLVDLILVGILFLFPEIVTFLPSISH